MTEYLEKHAKTIAALLVGFIVALLKQYLDLEIPVLIQDFLAVALVAYAVKRFANKATLSSGEKVNVNDVKEVVDAKVDEAIAAEPTHPGVAPPWKKK